MDGTVLEGLLANASIEVTAREPHVADAVGAHFPPGTDVHVTFLPGDAPEQVEDACIALAKAGYHPIPHLTARNIVSAAALERHLARLVGDAGVTTALVIAGDVDRAKGGFSASIDVLCTGVLERCGLRTIRLAGHPEGHPVVSPQVLDQALLDKTGYARDHGLTVEIVTQFGFEGAPIAQWLRHLRGLGIAAPVRIGVAGPAGTATLLKYAMRCGVGNSLRVLRKRGSMMGKLIGDTTPDEVLGELADISGIEELGPLAGIHIYVFGGLKKSAEWLARARAGAAGARTRSIKA